MTQPIPANLRRRTARRLRTVVTCAGFASLVSICMEYGFDEPPLPLWVLIGVQLLAVALYVFSVFAAVVSSPSVKLAVKKQWPDMALIGVGMLVLLFVVEVTHQSVRTAGAACVGAIQVLLILRAVAGAIGWNLETSQKRLHPSRLLVASFLILIVVGGCLLSLPKAVVPSIRAEAGYFIPLRILDSFFTATSATCVTGLVVRDTGQEFTRFGQVVILVLIQLGGLGIMVFASLVSVLLGKRLSLRESLALTDSLSHQTIGQLKSVVRFIILTTLVCEIAGAVSLYRMFADKTESLGDCVFHCVFHAVSAFCNAGFALQPDSLTAFGSSWGVYVSIMPLIIVGGLGFPVLRDLWGWWLVAGLRPVRPRGDRTGIVQPRSRGAGRRYRLNLHTKLVLTSSAILIIAPAILFFAFESSSWQSARQRHRAEAIGQTDAMVNMTVGARARAAIFQSVTARTAGFNTVATDVDSMSPASHWLLLLLMFVGGSPASTAGGVKTVAAAILVLGLISTLRGTRDVQAYNRRISDAMVRRAAVVVVVMFGAVFVVALALCYTESGSLRETLFESVSACGTVGLSTGLTSRLTPYGQGIIMLAMFAGRLGPLTLLIALAGSKPQARYEYPEEQVVIG